MGAVTVVAPDAGPIAETTRVIFLRALELFERGIHAVTDRTFVQGIVDSPVDSAIVRAVIDLANAMGISTVAEGVETEDQLAGLRMLGCPVAQGFYFSQPLRAEEFDELLTRHFAPTTDLQSQC